MNKLHKKIKRKVNYDDDESYSLDEDECDYNTDENFESEFYEEDNLEEKNNKNKKRREKKNNDIIEVKNEKNLKTNKKRIIKKKLGKKRDREIEKLSNLQK